MISSVVWFRSSISDPQRQEGLLNHDACVYHNATLERCVVKLWNEFERNAPESLTLQLSDFVHRYISRRIEVAPPNRVIIIRRTCDRWSYSLTSRDSRGQCDLMLLARVRCGTETNSVACTTPSPSGVGIWIR